MSHLSLPQSRVPGTLPLFYTSLFDAPRRIFWQNQPQNIACRLVFGIPQSDGTLCPITISKPQTSNVYPLEAMPLEAETLYGWQIETTEASAQYAKGEVLCEGRLELLNETDKAALPELLNSAQLAQTHPVVLMGMMALLCRFGLFQDALRIVGKSLPNQAVAVREMMQDTARFVIYNEMSKRIAAKSDGTLPAKFGAWAEGMKALYAKQTEQRKAALANVGKARPISAPVQYGSLGH